MQSYKEEVEKYYQQKKESERNIKKDDTTITEEKIERKVSKDPVTKLEIKEKEEERRQSKTKTKFLVRPLKGIDVKIDDNTLQIILNQNK
jgi:hypothetical protein